MARYSKASRHAKKAIKKSPFLAIVVFIVIVALVGCYFLYDYIKKKDTTDDGIIATVEGELTFHFLELGNKYAGDCIYIKAGDADILIDAGSRENSIPTIKSYLSNYVTDGILEYVIVTHADQDHIAGFAGNTSNPSLFLSYECKTIIDFALTDKTTAVYNRYVASRDAEVTAGATHYTALQCYNQTDGAKRQYTISDGITLNILYNYYYENSSSDENNYSVCVLFKHGERNFLFTGDLEEDGEERLVANNTLSQCELFKAGHHGSKTSSNECLLSVIKPKICVVTCVAGSDEYSSVLENQFPTQAFISRISKYTEKVYVTSLATTDGFTSLNGNVVVASRENEVAVECSYSNTLLKNTDWFINNRTWG